MSKNMPSPLGTNCARLFVSSDFPLPRPALAHDAALPASHRPELAGMSYYATKPVKDEDAPPTRPTTPDAHGIPEQAMAFLRSRLGNEGFKEFQKMLQRSASERPLSGSSLPAMDKRLAKASSYYVSMTTGRMVAPDGGTSARRPRSLDTRHAKFELDAFIKTGRTY